MHVLPARCAMAAPSFAANVAIPSLEDKMQPSRIRNATLRILRRGTSRALPLADLARMLSDEERIAISPDGLADSLRGDDGIALLERPDPIAALPLIVHETGPAYQEALGPATGCWAVVDTEVRPFPDAPDAFELLATPLLLLWREAAGDALLRKDVAVALGGLYAMMPALTNGEEPAV